MRSCSIISSVQTFYNKSRDEKNINALLELINISSQFLFAWFRDFPPWTISMWANAEKVKDNFVVLFLSFLLSLHLTNSIYRVLSLSSRRGAWEGKLKHENKTKYQAVSWNVLFPSNWNYISCKKSAMLKISWSNFHSCCVD